MESVAEINRKLIDHYGKDVGSNQPNYRVIKSTGLTETRFGTFRDHSSEGIFLREVSEIRETLKYPFDQDAWVLEVLTVNSGNSELKTATSYEPLWIFGNNNSERYPIWRAVDYLVRGSKMIDRIIKSPQDIKDEELKSIEDEKKLFKIWLQNESPYIAGALYDGAAVTVPSNYEKQTENKVN